jgi:hypothetical protein
MFKSNLEMNGKLDSEQIKDSMNPLLCSSECAIPGNFLSYDGKDNKLKRT